MHYYAFTTEVKAWFQSLEGVKLPKPIVSVLALTRESTKSTKSLTQVCDEND